MTKKTSRSLVAGCLAAAFLLWACGGGGTPVGRVEVEPSEIRLLYPGFSDYHLVWSPETPLEGQQGELRASVHLLSKRGVLLRTFDHALGFEWAPGATERSEKMLFQSALAPPLEEGVYELEVGLYDADGNIWDVSSSGATVRVETATEGFPAFYFSPEWQPIESGTDRQILGRRWLRADGVIRLGELTDPGTLWLQIGIPVALEGEQELVLDEGADGPEVVVASSCGASQTLRGVGSHTVMLPVSSGDGGVLPSECEIAIDANYVLIGADDHVRRTVALESLAWLTG